MKKTNQNAARLLSARRLLELLWDKQSRPSLRWLRERTRDQEIPHIRIGGRIYYDPVKVRQKPESVP